MSDGSRRMKGQLQPDVRCMPDTACATWHDGQARHPSITCCIFALLRTSWTMVQAWYRGDNYMNVNFGCTTQESLHIEAPDHCHCKAKRGGNQIAMTRLGPHGRYWRLLAADLGHAAKEGRLERGNLESASMMHVRSNQQRRLCKIRKREMEAR